MEEVVRSLHSLMDGLPSSFVAQFLSSLAPLRSQKMETDRPLMGEIRYLCFGAVPRRKGPLHRPLPWNRHLIEPKGGDDLSPSICVKLPNYYLIAPFERIRQIQCLVHLSSILKNESEVKGETSERHMSQKRCKISLIPTTSTFMRQEVEAPRSMGDTTRD